MTEDSKAVEAVARMIAATVFPRSASCLPSPFDAATGQQKRQLMDIARTAVDEHLAHLEAEGMEVVCVEGRPRQGKPTIEELEAILASPETGKVRIKPSGEVVVQSLIDSIKQE